jgi:rhamnosyltransferase subunit B
MALGKGHIWRGQRMPSALDMLTPEEIVDPIRSKRTLLIGWELGGGRGHVERLVPVVRAWLERGWHVVAALRDVPLGNVCLGAVRDQYGPKRLQIIQTPGFSERRFPGVPLVSLAQIFCYMGLDDPALVAPVVRQWEDIIRSVRPDVVLSDFAPMLNLATRKRFSLQVIGNGWTLPPDLDAVPLLVDPGNATESCDYEARLVACAQEVVGASDAPQRFCELLRGQVNVLCVIPELDPYRDHREDIFYWSPEMPLPCPRPAHERAGGLVYLPADHPDRGNITKACAQSNIAFRAYFGGDGAGQYGSLTVSAKPLDFISEIPRSKVVIHHGGLGTTMWAMVNEIPQWGCARDAEKNFIAASTRHSVRLKWSIN